MTPLRTPEVSVLMAVRDGAPWIADAVHSILDQTFADLELVVVDDGSADATPRMLETIPDERLRVHRQSRAGFTAALNLALASSSAALVARLDADDVALPHRIERQRAFMLAHPEVGLLGSAAREVDASGCDVAVIRPPTDDVDLRRALIRGNPFVHSSVMMRREAVERAGRYDERLAVAQDYDLWMRMSAVTRLANLSEVLVTRRLSAGQVSQRRDTERLHTERTVRWRAVRAGAYPWWCVVFAARPALAAALPPPLRRALRRARPS